MFLQAGPRMLQVSQDTAGRYLVWDPRQAVPWCWDERLVCAEEKISSQNQYDHPYPNFPSEHLSAIPHEGVAALLADFCRFFCVSVFR